MKKVLLILLLLGLFIGVVSCKKDEPKPVDPDPVDPVDPDPVDPDPIDPDPVDVTLTISDKEITLEEDEEKTITITVTEGYEYLVSIDNQDIVSFDNGVVKGLKEGKAIITVSVKDNEKQETINVTVNKKVEPVKEIKAEDLKQALLDTIEAYSKLLVLDAKATLTKDNLKCELDVSYYIKKNGEIRDLKYEYNDPIGEQQINIYVNSGYIYTYNNGETYKEILNKSTTYILKNYGVEGLFATVLPIEEIDFTDVSLVSNLDLVMTYQLSIGNLIIKCDEDLNINWIKLQIGDNSIEIDLGPLDLQTLTFDYPSDLDSYGEQRLGN